MKRLRIAFIIRRSYSGSVANHLTHPLLRRSSELLRPCIFRESLMLPSSLLGQPLPHRRRLDSADPLSLQAFRIR